MKKLLLVFCVNICAFSSILVTIRNELGNAFFLKIFIPLVVISAFNLVAVLMVFSKAQKEKGVFI